MRTEKAIAIGILLTLFLLVSSCTATIHVPDDYETIQAAVEAASSGDTIIVRDGHVHRKYRSEQALNYSV